MELVERYLHAVAGYLPKARAEDITRELRDALLSEIEDREAVLGRALDAAELEALLRERGHPMLVAAGYLPEQHLIGPATYPFWRQGMRLLMLGAFLIYALIAGISVAMDQQGAVRALMQGATAWCGTVLTWGALLTLVLALVERNQLPPDVLRLDGWSPAKLPPADALLKISRTEAMFSVVFGVLVLGWWTGFIDTPVALGRGGPLPVTLSAAWQPFYTPILVLMAAGVVLSAVNFVLPRWDALRLATHALINVAVIGVAITLLQSGELVDVSIDADKAERLARVINMGLRFALAGAAIASAWDLFQDGRRFARLRRVTSAS